MTVVGALVVMYAKIAMPVAMRGSDIVNIHLISERQNTTIIGGMLFLAGIVLFAVFKLKQTKEESDIVEAQQRERLDKAKVAIQNTSEEASTAAKSLMERLNSGNLSKPVRVSAGAFIGYYCGFLVVYFTLHVLWLYTDNYLEGYGEVLIYAVAMATAVLYVFRKISTIKVLTHLVGVAILMTVILPMTESILQTAKHKECEQATFRTQKCNDILYR